MTFKKCSRPLVSMSFKWKHSAAYMGNGHQLQHQRLCQKWGLDGLSKQCPMTFPRMFQASSVYESCKFGFLETPRGGGWWVVAVGWELPQYSYLSPAKLGLGLSLAIYDKILASQNLLVMSRYDKNGIKRYIGISRVQTNIIK